MSELSKSTISTIILTCRSALVPHYLSKGFLIVGKVEGQFENIPERVLKQINDSPLHDEYIILKCKAAIP